MYRFEEILHVHKEIHEGLEVEPIEDVSNNLLHFNTTKPMKSWVKLNSQYHSMLKLHFKQRIWRSRFLQLK